MSFDAILHTLVTWTPYLAEGFVWNILVSLVSMTVGTVIGGGLALLRLSPRRILVRFSLGMTEVCRNIPTFVFLFYLAYIIPVEIVYDGGVFSFPAWLKAALALSVAVVGFVSDNLSVALREWRAGHVMSALLFIPNWTAYLLIIIMASSTASVIGVGEIVSRCNTVIAAVGNDDLMLWIYLYAMLWFFLFSFPLTVLMNTIKARMQTRAV